MEIKNNLHHKKLVKTKEFLKEPVEDINSYRERKIRWSINEMMRNGQQLTVYKIEGNIGFDGGNVEIKTKIKNL